MLQAIDHIINSAAKTYYMSAGRVSECNCSLTIIRSMEPGPADLENTLFRVRPVVSPAFACICPRKVCCKPQSEDYWLSSRYCRLYRARSSNLTGEIACLFCSKRLWMNFLSSMYKSISQYPRADQS